VTMILGNWLSKMTTLVMWQKMKKNSGSITLVITLMAWVPNAMITQCSTVQE